MNKSVIYGDIFDGNSHLKNHAVVFDHGVIEKVVPRTDLVENFKHVFELDESLLVPGFIDIQVNGGGGVLFNNNTSVEAIRAIAESHRMFGTTGFFPTLITTSYEVMRRAVEAVDKAIEEGVPGVLGIHLEGPFLNAIKKGAHDKDKFCIIDDEALEIIGSLKNGKTLITIAPELTTPDMIQKIRAMDVIISIGHSAATYEEGCSAIDAGVTGFTHLYNGMTALKSREPGLVGAALADTRSWFGIIPDGHHMHPAAFSIAVAAKQVGGAVIVTDAMPTVGSKLDYFELDGEKIFSKNGRCVNAAGSLAGSDLDMITAVNNASKFAKIDYSEAIRMASLYAANAVELGDQLGLIKPGYTANFVCLNQSKQVERTWVNGDINV